MTSVELTVFTPIYRPVQQYFDECVASVLSQSFSNFEYLMINDGPVEDAQRVQRVFADPRIRIITTKMRLGLSGSRNAGLHEARGELIAFIDSDDFCEPDRFRRQIEFLRAHPNHVLVGSSLRYVDERSRTIGGRVYPERDEDIKPRMVVLNCIAQPTVIARRNALIEAGGYTNDFPFAEDYDLWLRAARLGKFHNLPEPLVAYRIHAEAGKNVRLRPALRDSTRVKIAAIRRYGFRPTIRAIASIAAHALLLLLPSRLVFWLFRKTMVTSTNAAP
jgi:GT2 family glycosyltransferase